MKYCEFLMIICYFWLVNKGKIFYLWLNEQEIGILFQYATGLWHHHSCSLPCHLGDFENTHYYNIRTETSCFEPLIMKFWLGKNLHLVHERPGLLKIFVPFHPTAAHLITAFDSE